ncbi:MAG: DUF2779 domain-containing protein [Salibacteraceae bacterium]
MSQINFTHTLTKTTYSRGFQCLKQLWYHRHEPYFDAQFYKQTKNFKGIDSPLLKVAFKLFPPGVECSKYGLEEEKDWLKSISKTKQAIEDGYEVLYNPSFYVDNLLCDIHLLVKTNDSYDAYIIKSSTRISDRVLRNSAYQFYVMNQAGLKVKSLSFVTINKRYIRKGVLEPERLFRIKDKTEDILNFQNQIADQIKEQLKTLAKDKPPKKNIGLHCTEPHNCSYKFKCWKNIPKNSVFELVGFSKEGMFDLWKRNIKTIDQIPNHQTLNWNQDLQRKGITHINKENLQKFLNNISFPIMLIDFEGIVPAIPQFENSKPFEIIPFLFAGISLNSITDQPEVFDHICPVGIDPRRGFAENFINRQENVNTILVYDPHTEKTIIKGLAKLFPDLKDALYHSLTKIIDLSGPIRRKDFYLPAMKGYHSMKYTLPAIDPSLEYSDLEIRNGRMAATTYQLLQTETHQDKIDKTLNELIEYCSRDTIGLLKVYQALLNAVK